MPVFTYALIEGDEIVDRFDDLFFSASDAPDEIEREGRIYKRIPSWRGGMNGLALSMADETAFTKAMMDKPAPHLYFNNDSPADRIRSGQSRDAREGF